MRKDNHTKYDQRIFSYLSGDMNPQERSNLLREMDSNAELRLRYEFLNSIWDEDPKVSFAHETNVSWVNFKKRNVSSHTAETKSKTFSIRPWHIAATIVLATLSFLTFQNSPKKLPIEQAFTPSHQPTEIDHNQITLSVDGSEDILIEDSTHRALTLELSKGSSTVTQKANTLTYSKTSKKAKPKYNTLTIPKGKRINLVLSDGTKVWLNSESSLRFPVPFSGDTREVSLSGEALFEVTKDRKTPFIVRVSDLDIRVYGTQFNVCDYPENESVRTVLVEGSVGIAKHSEKGFNSKKAVMLTPSQSLIYIPSNNRVMRETLEDTDEFTAWKDNRLVFYNQPFGLLKKRLERWYDVSIDNQCLALDSVRFSGEFENENISSVINYFSVAYPMTSKTEGRKITIMRKQEAGA